MAPAANDPVGLEQVDHSPENAFLLNSFSHLIAEEQPQHQQEFVDVNIELIAQPENFTEEVGLLLL